MKRFPSSIAKLAMTCLLAMVFLVTDLPLVSKTPVSPLLGVTEAQAQKAGRKRKSLFSILFGKRKVRKKQVKKRSKARVSKNRRKGSKKRSRKKTARKKNRGNNSGAAGSAASTLAAAPAIVEKLENAKKVLVVGDFFAGGLADGLIVGLLGDAGLVVVDEASGNSGLVRSDLVDWPTRIAELTTEHKPDYIVMMVGSNDRQALRAGGKKLKKRTEAWDEAYRARIATVADALKSTGKPYTWLGLPPVRFNSMNKDFLVFNEWYKAATTNVRGRFVDVWDGFADSDGDYSRSGPDVNGQIVLLRPKDGINLTKAGKRRLAFYVEGDIRRELGASIPTSALEDFSGVAALSRKTPEYDPAKTGKTQVIRLDDPSSDGAGELAGAELDRSSSLATDGAVQLSASTDRAPSGRVDSFVWPPVSVQQTGQSAVASR